ncbi:outer membrane protein [Helicobacter felis]|uniref:Outer membrane protein n=2 Tax=Helicobacter felis TaxID=214 RepID=E7ADA8_HELFC|nr:outer membrane protein [Helicobacter felis]CBY83165.1 outer membrane protein [Helicobacter felis ATCC 49179]SFZ71038.1 OMP926 [Helicobacter felis ATCC 49179]SFZ71152.1 OMP648 [Helicobacter felis]
MLVHKFIRRKFFTMGAWMCCALAPLSAGNNGGYFSIGFQYSNMGAGGSANSVFSSKGLDSATTDATSGNLFGGDVQLGYKQFFGKKKRFGMRYYAMFSAQGGAYSYPQDYNVTLNSDGSVNTISYTLTNGALTNLFYGAGWDVLIDFFQSDTRSFGIFGGIMLGGTSWFLGEGNNSCATVNYNVSADKNGVACTSTKTSYEQRAKKLGKQASYSPNYVQFAFNFGVRGNISKHNGFEIGVRAPVITTPYFVDKSQSIGSLEFRRLIVFFANYVVNF